MDLAHTMRVTGTHLELRGLQDFCRCAASGVDGDDLVVASVQDEGEDVDLLEVFGEVRLGEALMVSYWLLCDPIMP